MGIWSRLRLFVYLLVCLLAHRLFIAGFFFTHIGLAVHLTAVALSASLTPSPCLSDFFPNPSATQRLMDLTEPLGLILWAAFECLSDHFYDTPIASAWNAFMLGDHAVLTWRGLLNQRGRDPANYWKVAE